MIVAQYGVVGACEAQSLVTILPAVSRCMQDEWRMPSQTRAPAADCVGLLGSLQEEFISCAG